MRVVVALGGNALLKRGEPMNADVQRGNVKIAAQALAPLAKLHQLVISHGNGPQVGLLALQGAAYREVEAYPLDVLGAQTEGMGGPAAATGKSFWVVEIVAFSFAMWTIYGCGAEAVLYGLLLLLLGVPLYAWMQSRGR